MPGPSVTSQNEPLRESGDPLALRVGSRNCRFGFSLPLPGQCGLLRDNPSPAEQHAARTLPRLQQLVEQVDLDAVRLAKFLNRHSKSWNGTLRLLGFLGARFPRGAGHVCLASFKICWVVLWLVRAASHGPQKKLPEQSRKIPKLFFR